jgi:hypothetical protein
VVFQSFLTAQAEHQVSFDVQLVGVGLSSTELDAFITSDINLASIDTEVHIHGRKHRKPVIFEDASIGGKTGERTRVRQPREGTGIKQYVPTTNM